MSRYRFSAAEGAPGLPTIVNAETGRSILATVDRTPVFADLEVAGRVLEMLNAPPTPQHPAAPETERWECGPHANAWGGHDARCRKVVVRSTHDHSHACLRCETQPGDCCPHCPAVIGRAEVNQARREARVFGEADE